MEVDRTELPLSYLDFLGDAPTDDVAVPPRCSVLPFAGRAGEATQIATWRELPSLPRAIERDRDLVHDRKSVAPTAINAA